jgi:spore coat polysaccharide biosynthesis predicted glycosyltransferase SpsG
MIIFRTDDIPGPDRGTIHRTYYLALLLKKQIPVHILVNNKVRISPEIIKKNISVIHTDKLKKPDMKGLKSVVFDLEKLGPEDQALFNWSRRENLKTIQFTDFGLNSQPVDFIIDPAPQMLTEYPEDQNGLLGPQYAVLHTKFRHFNRAKKMWKKQPKNIFLSPGKGMTYRRLRDMIDELTRFHFNVKLNPGPMLRKSHKKILKRMYPQIRFVGNVESLARPFFESDIALIPAGTAAYAAAACGTPALYLHSSPQEVFIAESFEKKGFGVKADYSPDRSNSGIGEQIRSMNFKQCESMGTLGKQTVDALGVYRIIDFFRENNII